MNNRSGVFRFVGFALLLQVCCELMAAQQARWEPVTRADLRGTPDLPLRNPMTLDMRTSGDFNGDGVGDSAYVLVNREAREFRVLICLSRPPQRCDERVVTEGPLAHIRTLGISTVTRNSLRGPFSRPQVGEAVQVKLRESDASDFLHVFAFEASNAVYFLTDRGFEVVQVTD